jgi:hypothetical protein
VSIRSRLDALSRQLSFGARFDGGDMESIAEFMFADERPAFIPPGVLRASAYVVLCGIWNDLGSDREDEARSVLPELLGISDESTPEAIRDALVSAAHEVGLRPNELQPLLHFLNAQSRPSDY